MIKNFKLFIEDATATLGNMNGMGNVISAQPSNTPGLVSDSTPGSGDIGTSLGGIQTKGVLNRVAKKKKKKKKTKQLGEDYNNMYITNFSEWNQN